MRHHRTTTGDWQPEEGPLGRRCAVRDPGVIYPVLADGIAAVPLGVCADFSSGGFPGRTGHVVQGRWITGAVVTVAPIDLAVEQTHEGTHRLRVRSGGTSCMDAVIRSGS